MKSFCVLNRVISAAAGESIGSAAAEVIGKKLGVLCCGSPAAFSAAKHIAKGIKKQGGCAVVFNNAFESQAVFAVEHFSLDGAFFIDGDKKCRISVYDSSARALCAEYEEEISLLAAQSKLGGHRGGAVIESDLNSVYYKKLLEKGESFFDVSVKIKSSSLAVKTTLVRALTALGGEHKGRAGFFISASGLCLSAADEYGKIYTDSQLLGVCTALAVNEKQELEIPFSLPEGLDTLAQDRGVRLRRSFNGGNELWQRDAVFLAARLMKYMSQNGVGLCEICRFLPESTVARRRFSSAMSINQIADTINCEQLVSDGSSVYAKVKNANILLTPCSNSGGYCLEVQAADIETADEIALSLTDRCI